jgi:bifunctional DNA-binding transcriptional regulator/antitoxin component of YhaV-PrlF toxin-antitoxin module
MTVKTTITIDENGQILLPLEVNQYLNVQNYDWLQVRIQSDGIVIIPPQELDEEIVQELIRAGILIDIVPNSEL